jgi:hypothetical protein
MTQDDGHFVSPRRLSSRRVWGPTQQVDPEADTRQEVEGHHSPRDEQRKTDQEAADLRRGVGAC